MSSGKRWGRWTWGALVAAAPLLAQDQNSGKSRQPPPTPMPPGSRPSVVNSAPKSAPKQVPPTPAPAAKATQPSAGQPQNRPPIDPTISAPAQPDARAIIEGLATNKEDEAGKQREGLLAYQQALAAQQANRSGDALRLARKAKQLFPGNQDIANLVATLQRDVAANRPVTPSITKAKAYLAAGYARGLELMRTGRAAEGEDLLHGVVEASRMFPDQSQVDFYRRLAEHELEQYRVAHGNDVPNAVPPAVDPPTNEPPRALTTVLAPPDNARRLVRPEARVPTWYVQQKNKLAKSMSVDYKRISASQVLDDIAAKTGVEFVIDRPVALARSHINTLVDFRAGDVHAEFILDLVSQKAGFEYVIMERSIVVTTRSKALEYLRLIPDALRHNWMVARMLFPESNIDLMAAAPPPTPTPPNQADAAKAAAQARARALEGETPSHLQSGRALVAAIQVLLK